MTHNSKAKHPSTGLTAEAIENRVRFIEWHLNRSDGVSTLSEGTKNVIRHCLRGESIVEPETSIFDIYEKEVQHGS